MTTRIIKRIDFDPDFEPVCFDSPDAPAVIEHEVLTGIEKAGEIISRVRREATRLRKRAKEVLALAVVEKEEERKRGFEEGVQEGLGSLTERLAEAARDHEKMLQEAEPEIVRMVMEIAEKVIGREVERGAVADIVKKAILQSVGQKIVVRIHPLDLQAVVERQAEIVAAVDGTHSIVVKEDESVPAGGCIIETELATVDARLETQLAAIRKVLGL